MAPPQFFKVNPSATSRGGGAGTGSRGGGGGRGKPGYPVPAVLQTKVGDDGLPTVDDDGKSALETTTKKAFQNALGEAQADRVAIVAASFDPFTAAHGKAIRAIGANKIIVLVGAKGELPQDQRLKIVQRSLVDVGSKAEIYPMQQNELVPAAIDRVAKDERTSMDGNPSFEVYVPSVDSKAVQEQLRGANKNATVQSLPDDIESQEAQARQTLQSGDLPSSKKLLDPHLASSPDIGKIIGVQEAATPPKKLYGLEALGKGSDLHGENEIMALLWFHAERLKKRGVDVDHIHRLGAGRWGVAFAIAEKKVFKVTTEKKEAESSACAIGKDKEHVVHIYDAFRIPDPHNRPIPIFGIVREYLQPLSGIEQKELQEMYEFFKQHGFLQFAEMFKRWDYDAVVRLVKAQMPGAKQPTDPHAKTFSPKAPSHSTLFGKTQSDEPKTLAKGDPKFVHKLNPDQFATSKETDRIVSIMEKYKLRDILEDLKALKIGFWDFHGGNVMRRGSTLVVSELGGADSGCAPPTQLERVAMEAFEKALESAANFTGPGGSISTNTTGWSSASAYANDDENDNPAQGLKDLASRSGITGRKTGLPAEP